MKTSAESWALRLRHLSSKRAVCGLEGTGGQGQPVAPAPRDLVPRKATAITPGGFPGSAAPHTCCVRCTYLASQPSLTLALLPGGSDGTVPGPRWGGTEPPWLAQNHRLWFLLEQNNYRDLNSLKAVWTSAGNHLQKQKYIFIQSWKKEAASLGHAAQGKNSFKKSNSRDRVWMLLSSSGQQASVTTQSPATACQACHPHQ